MPNDAGNVFDDRDTKRIGRSVKWVENHQDLRRERRATPPRSQGAQLAFCRPTSVVANVNGWWPGVQRVYNTATLSWSEPYTCWMFQLNSASYADATTTFPGFVVGENPADGLWVICTWGQAFTVVSAVSCTGGTLSVTSGTIETQ